MVTAQISRNNAKNVITCIKKQLMKQVMTLFIIFLFNNNIATPEGYIFTKGVARGKWFGRKMSDNVSFFHSF